MDNTVKHFFCPIASKLSHPMKNKLWGKLKIVCKGITACKATRKKSRGKKNSKRKIINTDPSLGLDNTQIRPPVKTLSPTKKKFQRCCVQREMLASKTYQRTRTQILLCLQNSSFLCTLHIPGDIHHMICLFSARIDSLKQLFQWCNNKGKVALSQQIHKKILFL